MTSLTFYGGADEIGGNKILLEDKNAKIFLDFGESFTFFQDYVFGYLQPREGRVGLLDFFEFDVLPKIAGIYSKEMLKGTNMMYVNPKVDAVFISHCHMDHVNHIRFLDPKIPVHVGHGTKVIMDVNQETSSFTDYGKEHEYKTFQTGDKIKVKHLVIEPVHLDHSIPGAYGFIVHTSSGPIVYTGDFRMHGPEKKMTYDFIEKARKAKPVAMICEGTRIVSSEKNYTEEDVYKRASKVVSEAKNLVLADFSTRNIDRFKTFYKIAVENGRKLVIDTKAAHLYHSLRVAEKVDLPDVFNDKNILVYDRVMKRYGTWEKPYIGNKNAVKCDYVRKNQSEVLMMFNMYRMFELVSIKPKPKSDYIYSLSEVFLEGDENVEETKIRNNWLKHFKFNQVQHSSGETDHMHHVHASGHAPREDIIDMIHKIKPETLIPVHTDKQEEFKKVHKNVILPEVGKEIKI